MDKGDLFMDKGTFVMESSSLLDRILYPQVRGYNAFLPSVFNFSVCLSLLLAIRKIEIVSPFSLKIAKRIRLIGCIFILYGLIRFVASGYVYYRFVDISSEFSPLLPTLKYELGDVAIGVFILIIAFIYRLGVQFQEENKLTI